MESLIRRAVNIVAISLHYNVLREIAHQYMLLILFKCFHNVEKLVILNWVLLLTHCCKCIIIYFFNHFYKLLKETYQRSSSLFRSLNDVIATCIVNLLIEKRYKCPSYETCEITWKNNLLCCRYKRKVLFPHWLKHRQLTQKHVCYLNITLCTHF